MAETVSSPSAANAVARGGFLAAIFLMATSAIGPGFITQTATFTAKLGSAFAFAILASILIDFVVQLASRLHAYGPMGVEALTIERFVVRGAGQVRHPQSA